MSQWYLIVESISMWELSNCISSFKCLISCCTRNSKKMIAPLGALNHARQRKAPSNFSLILIWKNKMGAWSSTVSIKTSNFEHRYIWLCMSVSGSTQCWRMLPRVISTLVKPSCQSNVELSFQHWKCWTRQHFTVMHQTTAAHDSTFHILNPLKFSRLNWWLEPSWHEWN